MDNLQIYLTVILVIGLEVSGSVVPPATSHQSVVSGEGYRYGYGIVHGPYPYGGSDGESFPHGYGGFGAKGGPHVTYAPGYGYGKPIPLGFNHLLKGPPPPSPLLPPHKETVIIYVDPYYGFSGFNGHGHLPFPVPFGYFYDENHV